jgi:uncharacterized pyridoxal phosphate-containing UPF0001 family protein
MGLGPCDQLRQQSPCPPPSRLRENRALHLIGPLQTDKVRDAVALCDMIETVDRPRLAEALAGEMDRRGRRPPCLIEVNTGEEPQKSGFFPPRPTTSSSSAATGSACRSGA